MHFVIGTAGHIDHGKSSLVQSLTGTDPDRLPEEKKRGVTIDLGFAHLSLKDSEMNTTYEIGIVDVPGHSDFVNNMVSGVGALDLALFIIAADDGWMPQSEEHLHILSYLGIDNIIIALTKTDLCEDVPFSIEVLRDELQNTPIANAPIIPVSSITGDGIDDLKSSLLLALRNCPPPQDNQKPRLSIDRLFSPKGAGTVVTGTLTGGSISSGDTLVLQPQGIPTRVRYIQNHSHSINSAHPGMRTALNLPDLTIDAPGKPGASRGNTLTCSKCGTPSDTIDILLTRLERPIPGTKPRPLRHTESVILHHGSARCQARVILHNRSHLNPGESCLAQLRLDTSLFFLTGDRIVLRDGAQQNTLAGGTILDACPARQGFRTKERAIFLNPRAKHPNHIATDITTLLARDHFLDASAPLPNSPYSPQAIAQCIEKLTQENKIIPFDSLLLDASWWNQQLSLAEETVLSWHQSHPDLPTMTLARLEKHLPDCPPDLFKTLLLSLESNGFRCQAKTIAHSSHQLTLPDDLKPDAQRILNTLNTSNLHPPNRSELTPSSTAEQAMLFLIRSGQVVELDSKVIISQQALEKASSQVKLYLTQHKKATASELRQHLDTSRKVVMPLLEKLDELGLTQRNENFRTLR